MNRTNILFLIPQMGIGGSETMVLKLIRGLDRKRFNPSVAWLTGDDALQEFRDLEVPLYRLFKAKRVDFSLMRQLAGIIRDQDIHIVNAQHFMPAIYAFYGCKIAARRALVFTAHSRWEVEDTPVKWRIVGGWMMRRMDASIGVTADVADAIRTMFGLDRKQVVAIENGVDLEVFREQATADSPRTALGLEGEDTVIGIVANLKTVKNHLFLLRAFAEIVQEAPRAKLVVVGRGFEGEADNTEGALRQFISDRGLGSRVLLLGYRKDVGEVLRSLDVFCLVSLKEGLPVGLIEAMATGLPVVGSDVEGIRDVISPGRDGMLVELDNVAQLRDTLLQLVRDPGLRRRLGRKGRDKAMQRYSLRRCVGEYERLFAALAGPVRARG